MKPITVIAMPQSPFQFAKYSIFNDEVFAAMQNFSLCSCWGFFFRNPTLDNILTSGCPPLLVSSAGCGKFLYAAMNTEWRPVCSPYYKIIQYSFQTSDFPT
jgi:hypothetical protein